MIQRAFKNRLSIKSQSKRVLANLICEMAYKKTSKTTKTSTKTSSSRGWYSKGGYTKDKNALDFYGISIWRVQNPILRTCIEKYLDPLINGKGLELKKKLSLVDINGKKWDFSMNKQYETEYAKMQKAYEILDASFKWGNKELVISDISNSVTTLRRCEPFSLSTLQSECLNLLGMKPKDTMAAAQKLFEMGLTSYPRTDSITVPEEYEEKIKSILKWEYKHQDYVDKGEFVQAWHYAIIFTSTNFKYLGDGKLSIPNHWLSEQLADVYELVIRRTLGAFYKEEAKGQTTTYTGTYSAWKTGLPFELKTKEIIQKGFTTVYNYASDWDEEKINFQKGDKVKIKEIILKDVDIKISVNIGLNKIKNELESKGIARPSTWASILQTVEDKQLVKSSGANLVALPKGIRFWYLLQKENKEANLFDTFDLDLTVWMEKELDKVASWKEEAINVFNKILANSFIKYL